MKIILCLIMAAATACGQSGSKSITPPAGANSPVTVTYIANEGVLIAEGDQRVLIDGLHREYKPDYAFPDARLLSALEAGKAPYDQLDLILVSHQHLDHFHPLSVALSLKNIPGASLISSEQVVNQVREQLAKGTVDATRLQPFTPGADRKLEITVAGIKLTVLGLRHSGEQARSIQNLGHIVELGGKKFLHVGDAELSDTVFAGYKLNEAGIDVAILPYWYLLTAEGRAAIKKLINPKQIIAVHIQPLEAAEVIDQLKKVDPGVIPFTRALESRGF